MNAPGMAAAENVFNKDLGFLQVRFVPIHAAAERVHLNPVFTNPSAFLLPFLGHDPPFLKKSFFALLLLDYI
jgi:hypothetical protein